MELLAYSTLPEPGSRSVASLTLQPLLLFYALISVVLNQASMKPFNLMPYLKATIF